MLPSLCVPVCHAIHQLWVPCDPQWWASWQGHLSETVGNTELLEQNPVDCVTCKQQKFKFKQLRSLRPRLLMSFQTENGKVKIPFAEALFSPKSPHTTLGSRIQHQNFRGLQGFIYTYWSHMTLAGSRKNWIIKGGQLRENWAQSLKLSLVWWHRSIIPRP